MQLSKKGDWLFVVGVTLFLLLVLLWPLRYQVSNTDELPDPVGAMQLTRDTPSTDIHMYSARPLAGISFWTVEDPNVDKDTLVEISVTDSHTGTVVLVQTEEFKRVFDNEERKLTFTFSTLRAVETQEYLVKLRLPNASANESLSIRGPLANADDPTSLRLVAEPLEKRSLLSVLHTKLYSTSVDGEDVYYYWLRGGMVAKGENPYRCATDDTCTHHKNPGHFPLFYLLSAVSQKAGLHDFTDWIAFWRPIFLGSYVAIGVILFWTLLQRRQYELAVFALFFWLFNRWSMYVIRVAHVDFIALLFLTLSVVLFEKKRYWSAFLFGISLGIKQVAIFLAPLYIILVWVQAEKEKRWKVVLSSVAIMALVPLVASIPFLLDNPQGVVKGLLFSASRSSEANIGAPPLVSLLQINGSVGIAPMAFLMILVYLAAYRKQLPLSVAGLGIMLVFIAFNTVLFNQYFLWFVPFLPLALAELKSRLK